MKTDAFSNSKKATEKTMRKKTKAKRFFLVAGFFHFFLVLWLASSVRAVPTPHSISGFVYEDATKTTQVAWGTPFSVTDVNSGDYVSGTTGGGPFSGYYGVEINGDDGDTVIVRAENATHYGETIVTLNGDMYDVDVIMNNPKSKQAIIGKPTRMHPRMVLTNEAEPGDLLYFEVTVNNTGVIDITTANVTLDILNFEYYSVSWGPNKERSASFGLTAAEGKTLVFNNSSAYYRVPDDALENIHYLDILFQFDEYQVTNNTQSFWIRKIDNGTDVNATIAPQQQYPGLTIIYTLSFFNPFTSGNLTNLSFRVASDPSIQCSEQTTGATAYNLTALENETIVQIPFTCYLFQNITPGNYLLQTRVTYTNPNNETHTHYFAPATLSVFSFPSVSLHENHYFLIS